MEAPQSISITVYYKGFSMIITKRDADVTVKPLLDSAMEAIDYMVGKGFKPSWNEDTNKQALGINPIATAPIQPAAQANTKPCELHPGQTLTYKNGKYGGFWSHVMGTRPDGKPEYCNGYDKSKKMTVDEYERIQSDPDF